MSLAGVNVDASYSPDPNQPKISAPIVSFDAAYWDWKLTGSYNYADFYDLFGPTKLSRKGESLKLAHSQHLILDYPRTLWLDRSVAGYSDLNALPEYQNVSTKNIGNLLDANLGLKYSNLDRAQAAVDDETGTALGPSLAPVLHTWSVPQRVGKLRSWISAAAEQRILAAGFVRQIVRRFH